MYTTIKEANANKNGDEVTNREKQCKTFHSLMTTNLKHRFTKGFRYTCVFVAQLVQKEQIFLIGLLFPSIGKPGTERQSDKSLRVKNGRAKA